MNAPRACAAVLTAQGRGAIAIIRVWGPDALVPADAVFRPLRGPRLKDTRPGRLRLGRVGAGMGDEVVAVVLEGEAPEVEFQGHAGPAAIDLVLDALRQEGVTIREPESWVRARSPSAIAAAALIDLAQAPTLRSAEILFDQAEGALDRELAAIWAALPGQVPEARDRLDALLARAQVGLRLLDGWRIVLTGRPNVGKSRLLNALAGFERAIVHPTPGTTRDVVTVRTAIDGWPVELADTAGLRSATDPVEMRGLELAWERRQKADLVVLVLDRSEPLAAEDHAAMAAAPEALRVATKADLHPAWDAASCQALPVSALSQEGLDRLQAAIAGRLVPVVPPPGAGLPFRVPQVERLRRLRFLLGHDRVEAVGRMRTWWL